MPTLTTARREQILVALGLVFLVAYATPIIWATAPSDLVLLCDITQVAVWVAFALDLVVRLITSRARGRFLLENWMDVLLIAVPALRPLRLLRALSAASLISRRLAHGSAFRTTLSIRVGLATVFLWFLSALAVTEAERATGNIKTFGQGMWWGLTTMTTVGYGDAYPVSTTGRVIAGALMLIGIGLLAIVTASVASWIIEQVNESDGEKSSSDEVAQLKAEVTALKEELAALQRP